MSVRARRKTKQSISYSYKWFVYAAVIAGSLLAIHRFVFAVDPTDQVVYTKNYNTFWPDSVNTRDGFDKASRASILIYIQTLHFMGKMTDEKMISAFKIKGVNHASVAKWINQELNAAVANYTFAAQSCTTNDWTCINIDVSSMPLINVPSNLTVWHNTLKKFTNSYVAEQMRLAALFPKVSSEIGLFSNNEWNGESLPDRTFYLSFDDGPSAANGNTDQLIQVLIKEKRSAVFFVLGKNLRNRLNRSSTDSMSKLYGNQCIASHGWEHLSHAKWKDWQYSIKNSQTLIKSIFPRKSTLMLFRPPYGERQVDSGIFFQEQHLKVALWNLDSKDWSNKMVADSIYERMITLMLIKRHGILLFHDIHPKAAIALPKVFATLDNSIIWGDCHDLSKL